MSIEKRELEVRLKYAKTLIGIYKKEVESLKEEIEKLKKTKTVIDESNFNKLKEFFNINIDDINSIEEFTERLKRDFCPGKFGLIEFGCRGGCDKCWEKNLKILLEKDGE